MQTLEEHRNRSVNKQKRVACESETIDTLLFNTEQSISAPLS